MPFIRKVHVLFKTRLIFSRINGPIVYHRVRKVGRKHVEKATASLLEEYGWLSSNDLEDISRRVVQSVLEGGNRIENLSIESLQEEMLNELNELKLHKQAEGQEKSSDRR